MDAYTWNNRNSLEYLAIRNFLLRAEGRMDIMPNRMPFDPMQGRLVLAWLRHVIDLKPSEMLGHEKPT